MPEKRCSKCGIVKPLSEFGRDRTKRDGHRARCGDCTRAQQRREHPGRPGREAGRQPPDDGVVCVYDPTGTYLGEFDRMSWAGTLYDGYWPDGMLILASAEYNGPRALWRIRGKQAHEVGGSRVLVADGKADRPVLRVRDLKR